MNFHRSKRANFLAPAVALMVLGLVGAAITWQPVEAKTPDHHMSKNIVETAVGAGSFKTLVAALQAAELVDALQGEGPFTVFAPSDEAFAKIPAATIEELLKPANKEKLRAILLYHVVPGKVAAADVVKLNGREVKTLEGSKVKVSTKSGVMVDNARVVKTDIMTSNGIIHVIDTVIMPKM